MATTAVRRATSPEPKANGLENRNNKQLKSAGQNTFLDIQNGFYNGITQALGATPAAFQLFQPSTPLVSGPTANQELWNYLNNIPPFSLTQNYIAGGGNQFFSDYKGLLAALKGQPNTFQADIGEICFAAWVLHVSSLTPFPSPNQLPQLFFNWASVFFPSVANVGASDLAQMVLDPITAAQTEISWAYGNNKMPDWSAGYSELMQQLSQAPSRGYQFSSDTMNSNVQSSWTGGSNSGFFGLWGGSSSSSNYSSQFAASSIAMSATFDHVMTFSSTPGLWYSSAAMALAFNNKNQAPWDPKSPLNWDKAFGADGVMQRFTTSLIVVSGMKIQLNAATTFSQEERSEIESNSSNGMWPFYSSGGGSDFKTDVKFSTSGALNLTIASDPTTPIVVGCNVLPVAQFVGHATETAQLLFELSRKK
jgi:hypothetical protein